MSKWDTFDEYGRNAQLKPALVAFLPLTMSLLAWTGTGSAVAKTIGGILATSGATYALAMIARNRGREIQRRLWDEWGGSPTIQLVRHRGTGNPVLRERWHRDLEKKLGQKFPTAEEEAADPDAADSVYDAATRLLINERRDKTKYPLIFRENVNYGFCRNLFALRGIGIVTAIIGIVASAACGLYTSSKVQALPWGCCMINFLILIAWVFIVTRSWVKPPALAYAERLLESCDPAGAPRKTIATNRKSNAIENPKT
jgi:hypothetical protein